MLEDTRGVDTVILDKTGTVTTGDVEVIQVEAFSSDADPYLEVLAPAAAVEQRSEHPIARAIAAAGSARGTLPESQDFKSYAGGGVRAVLADGRTVVVGKADFLDERRAFLNDYQRELISAKEHEGFTTVAVAVNGKPVGIICLQDAPKPDSAQSIAELKAFASGSFDWRRPAGGSGGSATGGY